MRCNMMNVITHASHHHCQHHTSRRRVRALGKAAPVPWDERLHLFDGGRSKENRKRLQWVYEKRPGGCEVTLDGSAAVHGDMGPRGVTASVAAQHVSCVREGRDMHTDTAQRQADMWSALHARARPDTDCCKVFKEVRGMAWTPASPQLNFSQGEQGAIGCDLPSDRGFGAAAAPNVDTENAWLAVARAAWSAGGPLDTYLHTVNERGAPQGGAGGGQDRQSKNAKSNESRDRSGVAECAAW